MPVLLDKRTVLLDTQAFIMAATENWTYLPKRVQNLLANRKMACVLSSISVAEIAIKSNIGKLRMSPERVNTAVADLKLTVIPYTRSHAQQLFNLPLHHREPFDRMLIATAIVEDIPLVGGDARFPACKQQRLFVIWSTTEVVAR